MAILVCRCPTGREDPSPYHKKKSVPKSPKNPVGARFSHPFFFNQSRDLWGKPLIFANGQGAFPFSLLADPVGAIPPWLPRTLGDRSKVKCSQWTAETAIPQLSHRRESCGMSLGVCPTWDAPSMGRTGLGLPWPRLSPKKPSDPPLPRSPW